MQQHRRPQRREGSRARARLAAEMCCLPSPPSHSAASPSPPVARLSLHPRAGWFLAAGAARFSRNCGARTGTGRSDVRRRNPQEPAGTRYCRSDVRPQGQGDPLPFRKGTGTHPLLAGAERESAKREIGRAKGRAKSRFAVSLPDSETLCEKRDALASRGSAARARRSARSVAGPPRECRRRMTGACSRHARPEPGPCACRPRRGVTNGDPDFREPARARARIPGLFLEQGLERYSSKAWTAGCTPGRDTKAFGRDRDRGPFPTLPLP